MSIIIILFVNNFQPHLINDDEFDFLIACTEKENKIQIFKGEEEEEELEHDKGVTSLIHNVKWTICK